MAVSIIILNYRTADLTVACLKSLAGQNTGVIVVDNFSNDGSIEKLSSAIRQNGWNDWVTLLPLPQNLGFAGGNNHGIAAAAGSEFILLLNNDTIVPPGTITACLNRMRADPTIGVMSCLLRNADGSMQNAARKFPTPARMLASAFGLPWLLPGLFGWADIGDSHWDRLTVSRDVDWIGGAFFFIRAAILSEIGLLDEDFFFSGEDIEFCHRVWKAGFRVFYDPSAHITHIGGQSSGQETQLPKRESRYLVQKKCYGSIAAAALRCADNLAGLLRRLRSGKTK